MRRVKLTRVDPPDKTSIRTKLRAYGVSFAPGYHIKYKNLKHAKADLATFSALINEAMSESNILLVDLFALYRSAWFYFEDKPRGKVYTRTEDKLRTAIVEVIESMDKLAGPYVRSFGTFGAYKMACESLEGLADGFTILEKFFSIRSDWSRVNQCQAQKKRARDYLDRLDSFLNGLTHKI